MTSAVENTAPDESEPTIGLLCALLRRPSITPDDAGCQALIAARLAAIGFHCEPQPYGDVTNLWARRGSDAPLLCFAGHTDVVPPGDLEQWSSHPFEPVVRDGNLFARGAADMKCGVAAMVVAAEQFVAAHPDHRGSLAFLITSDEEGPARDGTRKVVEALSARGESIDWCVLGEPSSQSALGDTVRIGRRGSLSGMLTINGVQGHVAYPDLADNPIRRFAPLLARLYDTVWDRGNEHFPPTSFQVVRLQSDAGAPNVTPSTLEARFNLRYSTAWDFRSLRSKVESIVDECGVDYTLAWHLSGEPFLTRPGTLTDAVRAAVHEVTGRDPGFSTGGGTSDGRFIAPGGADVVELGAVNRSIHQVNEFVCLEDVVQLTALYRSIAERLLI